MTRSLAWLVILICACAFLDAGCAVSAKYKMARDSYDNGILLRNQAKEQQSHQYFRRTITYLRPLALDNSLEPAGLLLLGNSYLYLNKLEEARKVYWKIIRTDDPEKADKNITGNALLGLGETYERQGYPDAAKDFYESVLDTSSNRSEESHVEAAIRWAGIQLHTAGILRDREMIKQSDKTIADAVKELLKLVHRYPSNPGLRRALGNAYFVMSAGENIEYLQTAFTQIQIALGTPAIPVILKRMLMDDFNTIADTLLGLMKTPEEQQEFRNRYHELIGNLDLEPAGDNHAEDH